ncbi:MAG: hypothetical protein JNK96_04300, partial [Betaproteobacteria bacterium]|nr:hypothetical protein [Betaproteobacteria bacterium]
VPEQAVQLVQAGAASSDPAQAAEAITSYVALALKDEGLARESFNLKGDAKLRADFALSRLRQNPINAMLGTDALREKVAGLTNLSLRMGEPDAKVPKEQLLLAAATGREGQVMTPENAKVSVRTNSIKILTDAVFNQGTGISQSGVIMGGLRSIFTGPTGKGFGNPQGSLFGGNVSFKGFPDDVLASLEKNMEEEYPYQKSLNPTDPEAAAKAAQNAAVERTLHEHPPSQWGGNLIFGKAGETPYNSINLRKNAEIVGGKWFADNLWNSYIPIEEKSPVDGSHIGWRFQSIEGSHAFATDLFGRDLVISDEPEPPKDEELRLNPLKGLPPESLSPRLERMRRLREIPKLLNSGMRYKGDQGPGQ